MLIFSSQSLQPTPRTGVSVKLEEMVQHFRKTVMMTPRGKLGLKDGLASNERRKKKKKEEERLGSGEKKVLKQCL